MRTNAGARGKKKLGAGEDRERYIVEERIDLDKYRREDSSIIVLAKEQRGKAVADKKKIGDSIEEEISVEMVMYVNMLASGINSTRACRALGISRSDPILWMERSGKDGIFSRCMDIIKQMQADDLEECIWDEALRNPKSTLLKMFAMKARKDEYKDNAPPAAQVQTNIRISFDGKLYDTSINFKAIESGEEEVIEAK